MESCVYNKISRLAVCGGWKGHTAGPRLRCRRRWQVCPPPPAHAQVLAQVLARVLSSAFTAGPTAGPQRFGEDGVCRQSCSRAAHQMHPLSRTAQCGSAAQLAQCSAVSTVRTVLVEQAVELVESSVQHVVQVQVCSCRCVPAFFINAPSGILQ
jgi:hypothetical protein